MSLLFALLSVAHATTAHVCVRNDGAGTFQPTSLSFFADTYGSEHDGSAIGPAAALAPGGNECVSISGLRATNIDYPETVYTFTVSWSDTDGTASTSSSTIVLDVDKFVGAAGAHSYYLDPSSYLVVSNAAPPAPGVLEATWDAASKACEVTVTAPSGQPLDFGTYRLERIDDSEAWTEVDAWQHPDPYTRSDDTVTGDGDARYRVVSEDVYGARTEGPEAPCVGSHAADETVDTGLPEDTGGSPPDDTGEDDTDSDDTDSDDTDTDPDDSDSEEGDSIEADDGDGSEDADKDGGGCATGAGPVAAAYLSLALLVGRRRKRDGVSLRLYTRGQ